VEVAEGDGGGGAGDNDARVAEPMKAMKRPMPPPTAAWSWWGIAATRRWRIPVKVSARKITRRGRRRRGAVCQGTPIPLTTV